MANNHNTQETKAERQARERQEAEGANGKPSAQQGTSKRNTKSLRISVRYFFTSIRVWLTRIMFACLLSYGLYLFYTDFTQWAEQEIRQ